jgi:CheY-like chemotaxis protein
MHILLVEDSRDDASLLADFLAEERNAPDVHWVTDGKQALDYLAQQGKYQNAKRPDVILMDLAMPRFGGYEALKELKQTPPYSDIPVIVLTTSHNPVDYTNCLRLGASGFFSKPFNLQGYEDLVQKLMNSEFPRLTQPAPCPLGADLH